MYFTQKSRRYGNIILNFGKIVNLEFMKNRENREIRIKGEKKKKGENLGVN